MKLLDYFNENDRFVKECGGRFTVCEPGRAEVELLLEERHMSNVGRKHVHAGLLYTMAESASAAAVLAYGYNSYAVEGHITYMDAASEGKITAVAKAKDCHGEENGSCRVRILAEDGRIIAQANFVIFYDGSSFAVE